MTPAMAELDLDTIAGGAAHELFERELREVIKNIADPNTKPDVKRTITVKVTFEPHGDREGAHTYVEASSKLAPAKAAIGTMYLAQRDGSTVGVTNDPRQSDLFERTDGVEPMPRREQAAG